jgi:hypothetical protein
VFQFPDSEVPQSPGGPEISEKPEPEPDSPKEIQDLLDRLNAQLSDPNGPREVSLDDIFGTDQFGKRVATLSDVKSKKGGLLSSDRIEGRFESNGKKQRVTVVQKDGTPVDLDVEDRLSGKFTLTGGELRLSGIEGVTAIGVGPKDTDISPGGFKITPDGGREGKLF